MNKKRRLWTYAAALLSLTVTVGIHTCPVMGQTSTPKKSQKKKDNALEASRAINVFRSVVTGVQNFYVDTVDVKKITSSGINAMLAQLDPYTEYMTESESEDFKFMTTGAYGGIGAYIQEKDSSVYVQGPMPGTPAEHVGLKMGDKFVEIDGQSVIPGTANKVSSLLKGPIGTQVKVKVLRYGEEKLRDFVLTRDNVVVDQVLHREISKEGIGYIRLGSFTNKSASDVLKAYNELNGDKKRLKALVLDLRSNGGGVMDDAIKILSMFVPQNTLVLYTEGKLPETTQRYFTSGAPIDTKIPIVVLINNGSASASEIVAGAMQDLDRAVVIGSKSFGKGLVQSTRALPYNGILKLTIARYHIPSGRCVQQLDYSHRNPDGSVAAVPDSLTKVFKTSNGREVRDGGGIRPDIEIEDEYIPSIVYNMIRKGLFFEFSNKLYLQKPKPTRLSDIVVTDEDYEAFLKFVESEKFEYGKMSMYALDKLKELAEFEGFKEQSTEAFDALKKALTPSLRRDVAPHKETIKRQLRSLLAAHYFGSNAQYAIGLESDSTYAKAIEILTDKEQYRNILSPKTDK